MARNKMALIALMSLGCAAAAAPDGTRWQIEKDGGIVWNVKPGEVHRDTIEMSGRKVSAIVTYGVAKDGALTLSRQVVFPTLRTIPNNTHASLIYAFGEDAAPRIFIGGWRANEVVKRIHHRGLITVESTLGREGEVALVRTIFPSTGKPALIEKYAFTNHGTSSVAIEVENTEKTVRTAASRGVRGEYLITSRVQEPGVKTLQPGEQRRLRRAVLSPGGAVPGSRDPGRSRRERAQENGSRAFLAACASTRPTPSSTRRSHSRKSAPPKAFTKPKAG